MEVFDEQKVIKLSSWCVCLDCHVPFFVRLKLFRCKHTIFVDGFFVDGSLSLLSLSVGSVLKSKEEVVVTLAAHND